MGELADHGHDLRFSRAAPVLLSPLASCQVPLARTTPPLSTRITPRRLDVIFYRLKERPVETRSALIIVLASNVSDWSMSSQNVSVGDSRSSEKGGTITHQRRADSLRPANGRTLAEDV